MSLYNLANNCQGGQAEGVTAAGGVEAGEEAGEHLLQVPGDRAVMTEHLTQPSHQVKQ